MADEKDPPGPETKPGPDKDTPAAAAPSAAGPDAGAAPTPPPSERPPPPVTAEAAARESGGENAPPPAPTFGDRVKVFFEAARMIVVPIAMTLWVFLVSLAIVVWEGIKSIRPPRTWRESAVWAGWSAGIVVVVAAGFFFWVTWDMPSEEDIWRAPNGQAITIVDRDGRVLLREGAQFAEPVDLATLPDYVGQAFIAIEDRRFYEHMGVDIGGLLRAGSANLSAGEVVQGGSTITQQLAKNLFLTNERSWRRKLQEIAMALWLEGRFTKDEILALYLSRVYFGASAYGIEAAAQRYFDRPARDLTLAQAALLAGLVKAPSRLNPARQEQAARQRAVVVLNAMEELKFITPEEKTAALNEPLLVSRENPAGNLGYFRDYIEPLLRDTIGDLRDDFVVETTLDLDAQRAGESVLSAAIAAEGEALRYSQGAILAIDGDGGIRTMVGGRAYGKLEGQSEFNRTTQSRRQPGSSFKYFIYLAAMEAGFTPWTVRNDAPVTINGWSPGNYNDRYNGPVSLLAAFQHSMNMVAIIVAHEVGGQNVIEVARRLGVRSELHAYDSLALGAQELTLMEMVSSYGAMANGGYRVEPHGVVRIRRANGETVWRWRPESREQVIPDRPRRYMNLLMSRVVEAGTGTRARIEGRAIGGKTGTTNDYADAWFVGFTPGLTAGVWVGNDDHRIRMNRVTGGVVPAQIWHDFMVVAVRNLPAEPLEMPTSADYALGPPPEISIEGISRPGVIVGAPIGPSALGTAQNPPDEGDRSLDFGPEG